MSISADKVFTEGWGNYAIQGIVELQLPEESIPLWPQTSGWPLLALLLLAVGLFKLQKTLRRYWKNRYRRIAVQALFTIKQNHERGDSTALRQIPELIKATALQAYPRTDIAALFGHDWEIYLDNSYSGPSFVENFPGLLYALSYSSNTSMAENCNDCFWRQLQLWIQSHHDAIELPAAVTEAL